MEPEIKYRYIGDRHFFVFDYLGILLCSKSSLAHFYIRNILGNFADARNVSYEFDFEDWVPVRSI